MKGMDFSKFKFKYLIIGLISTLMVSVWLLLTSSPIAVAQVLSSPLGLNAYRRSGNIVYAPVRLDGRSLFWIAAEQTKDTNDQLGLETIQMRRNRIENRLQAQVQLLAENRIAPELVQVITTQLNQQSTVQVIVDGKPSKPIVTVTALDAEIYGLSEIEVAEEYAQKIRQGLLHAAAERQPMAQRSHLQQAAIGTALSALLSALLFAGQRQIGKARQRLRQEFYTKQRLWHQQQQATDIDEATAQEISPQQQKLFDLKQQIERKTIQKRIFQLLLVGVGVMGFAWILQRFPQTRSLGILFFRQPVGLLLLGLSIAIAIVLSHLLIDWLLTKWVGTQDQFPPEQIERRRRRALTLSPVWKNVSTALLIIIGLIIAYSFVSLLTGVVLFAQIGFLGLAVSLAFQSSIKDALAGCLLLVQDAFAIGDLISVNEDLASIKENSGIVEEMGLLMTQIRSSSGGLTTLRNGEITIVTNHSKGWSRMDFTVLVDYETDVKLAMQILSQVFEMLQADSTWGAQLLSKPDILGVERFDQYGILLKIRARTQPGQQFNVTREFRLRLNQAFKHAGIKIPVPQREVRHRA